MLDFLCTWNMRISEFKHYKFNPKCPSLLTDYWLVSDRLPQIWNSMHGLCSLYPDAHSYHDDKTLSWQILGSSNLNFVNSFKTCHKIILQHLNFCFIMIIRYVLWQIVWQCLWIWPIVCCVVCFCLGVGCWWGVHGGKHSSCDRSVTGC